MNERPILMSFPMVQATLADRKTHTRRLVKTQTPPVEHEHGETTLIFRGKSYYTGAVGFANSDGSAVYPFSLDELARHCPHGAPGDRLWVRETIWVSACGQYYARQSWHPDTEVFTQDGRVWRSGEASENYTPPRAVGGINRSYFTRKEIYKGCFKPTLCELDPSVKIIPCTGNAVISSQEVTFRKMIPAIFMPRWASRITLEITAVRVERLQRISSTDMWNEGCLPSDVNQRELLTHTELLERYWIPLWDSLNGERSGASWADNPFVFVIEYKRLAEEGSA